MILSMKSHAFALTHHNVNCCHGCNQNATLHALLARPDGKGEMMHAAVAVR